MRVLLVTDWGPVEGGVQRYVERLRAGLREAGDEVSLLTSSAGSAAGGSADLVASSTGWRAGQAVLQLVNPGAVSAARRAVRKLRPDVVHVCSFEQYLSPAVFAAFRGVPTVLTIADYKPVCPTAHKLLPDGSICGTPRGLVCRRSGCVGSLHWLRDVPRYALIERAVRSADRVLAPSVWTARALRALGIDAEACRLGVPPVDPGFRRAPAETPAFLFVARLSREKGADVLLRAFAGLTGPAELRLAGDGPERRRLEALAASLGLAGRIRFLGEIGPERLDEELARAWALVAPSLWAEPLGLIAIDALVRGVPVVATAVGGFGETVAPGEDGILVANGDERGLAGALCSVASGSAFPGHRLPDDRVEAHRRRFAFSSHVAEVRQRYAALAGAR